MGLEGSRVGGLVAHSDSGTLSARVRREENARRDFILKNLELSMSINELLRNA